MALQTKSLVKETSLTTGTGAYTLAGAATGYVAFGAAFTPAVDCLIPYVARMGADYEIGYGTLSAGTTLDRSVVFESSNVNAAVDWLAGTKEIYVATSGEHARTGKPYVEESLVPTTTNNYAEGYGYGSLWHVVGNSLWTCTTPGDDSSPDAEWKLLWNNYVGTVLDPSDEIVGASLGFDVGLADTGVTNVVNLGQHGLANWSGATSRGFGMSASQVDFGGHQCDSSGFRLETTDATPTIMEAMAGGAGFLVVPDDSCIFITAHITARCQADDDVSAWELKWVLKRTAAGNPTLVGSETKTVVGQSAGAAAWDVANYIDTTNDGFNITVTGAAAKTIRWSARIEATIVANK